MKSWIKTALILTTGVTVSAAVAVFGTPLVFMFIAAYQHGGQIWSDDGELFDAVMASFVAMPIVFVVGIGATLWIWDKLMPLRKRCCQGCGYNLKGNTTGTCPECGLSISTLQRMELADRDDVDR